jgi:Holliday junction resolvase RusA-like endonuclease
VEKSIGESILASEFTEAEREKARKMAAEMEERNPWWTLSISVAGEAKAQSRHRHCAVFKEGKFKGTRTYDPAPISDWKKALKTYVLNELPDDFVPIAGAVVFRVKIFKSPPKSFSRAKLALCEMGVLRPEKKPDFDNYAKSVCDAFKGIMWADDCQVVDGGSEKYYSLKPRIEVSLEYRQHREDK